MNLPSAIFAFFGAAGTDDGPFRFLYTLSGPSFLVIYFCWFLLVWLGVLFLRKRGYDTPFTTMLGLALYEGLGGVRYIVGSAHGLQKWGFLVCMMLLGSLFFLTRANQYGSGDGGFSTGCGGGCGGGGCGGGGCGGCGS